MEKLNNKGLSIIELLVCFVIVSVIAITLLNTVMEYKSDEITENVRSHILAYKNAITRVIQTDILNNKLVTYTVETKRCKIEKDLITDVDTCVAVENTSSIPNGAETGEIRKIKLTFAKPFGNTESLVGYNKVLEIVKSDKLNYISYEDVVLDNGEYILQNVRYTLEPYSKVQDVDTKNVDSGTNIKKKEYNDVRFLTLGSVDNTNNIFTLKIPIYYNEFGTKYQISIIAPFANIY